MIERFFMQAATLSRLRNGLLGPHLPEVASSLYRSGYSRAGIRLHLRAADHFGAWLLEHKIEVPDINDAVVERYVQGLDRLHSRRARPKVDSLTPLWVCDIYLKSSGIEER